MARFLANALILAALTCAPPALSSEALAKEEQAISGVKALVGGWDEWVQRGEKIEK